MVQIHHGHLNVYGYMYLLSLWVFSFILTLSSHKTSIYSYFAHFWSIHGLKKHNNIKPFSNAWYETRTSCK